MKTSDYMDLVNVNCITPTRLVQTLVPQLKKRKERSAIINVSSVAPIVCCGYMTTYAASKGYLTAFSRSLAAEL
jgi:short-subunit dehydrogenase